MDLFTEAGIPLDVAFSMPIFVDKADLIEHIKQEGQKLDDAEVPTHLWSLFFRESFLHYFGIISGEIFIRGMIGSGGTHCQRAGRWRWIGSDA